MNVLIVVPSLQPSFSFVGSQAIDQIQTLGFASNSSEAEAFGGKLIAAQIVKNVDETENTIKDDIFFYQFILDLSAVPDLAASNDQQVLCPIFTCKSEIL